LYSYRHRKSGERNGGPGTGKRAAHDYCGTQEVLIPSHFPRVGWNRPMSPFQAAWVARWRNRPVLSYAKNRLNVGQPQVEWATVGLHGVGLSHVYRRGRNGEVEDGTPYHQTSISNMGCGEPRWPPGRLEGHEHAVDDTYILVPDLPRAKPCGACGCASGRITHGVLRQPRLEHRSTLNARWSEKINSRLVMDGGNSTSFRSRNSASKWSGVASVPYDREDGEYHVLHDRVDDGARPIEVEFFFVCLCFLWTWGSRQRRCVACGKVTRWHPSRRPRGLPFRFPRLRFPPRRLRPTSVFARHGTPAGGRHPTKNPRRPGLPGGNSCSATKATARSSILTRHIIGLGRSVVVARGTLAADWPATN